MGITVSAPGKTILIGEHAAVYGRPALVAAVDRRLRARLQETGVPGVRLELPEVGVSTTVDWPALRAYGRAARARWEAYERRPGPEAFRRLRGDDPAHLVKVALSAAAELRPEHAPGIELSLRSEIPIGAGFGSSAAAAVAIAYAFLALTGEVPETAELERLSLEIERRQHGTPSGIDTATVISGGLIWAARDAHGHLTTSSVTASAGALDGFRVFNTGTPAEATGAVVAAVRARRDGDPEHFERLLERMEAATRELRRGLQESGGVTLPMREFEACLEAIGVVPPRLREIVREVEARGGAAKISGAGALSGAGAGSLLVYHQQPREIDRWSFLDGLEKLDIRLGAGGVRVEEPGRQIRQV